MMDGGNVLLRPGIRVLRLFSRLNIGGPSYHVVFLTARLRQRGYDTRLVVGQEAPHEGDLRAFAAEQDVEPVTMPHLGRAIRPLADLRTLAAVFALIRSFRPVIVHTHTAKAGFIGRLAARLARVPIVVHTYHGHVLSGYFGRIETVVYRWAERVLARGSDRLVTVSEAVKRDLLGLGIGTDHKICVIPLGLELRRLAGELPRGCLRKESGCGPEDPLVGVVGRLVPIKDLPTFLAAARLVTQSCPKARFAVVGDGQERTLLEEQSRALGLDEIVYFHGWKRDTREVFGDLDVVVNCSRNEGTPVALIEGLAAARPVVATSVGGTPDLLGQGRFGTLVPPGDPAQLAKAIVGSLQEQEDARSRSLAGQQYVLTHHTIERLVRDMDALYRELLCERRARIEAYAAA
jgi:glycosyltransferase involved in cell wall biosynthesis